MNGPDDETIRNFWNPIREYLEKVLDSAETGTHTSYNFFITMRTSISAFCSPLHSVNHERGLRALLKNFIAGHCTKVKDTLQVQVARLAELIDEGLRMSTHDDIFLKITQVHIAFRRLRIVACRVFNVLDQDPCRVARQTTIHDLFVYGMRESLSLVKGEILPLLLLKVKRARYGNYVDLEQLRCAASMFVPPVTSDAQQIKEFNKEYRSSFEEPYLNDVEEFYGTEAAARLSTSKGHYDQYVEWVTSRFSFEEKHAKSLVIDRSIANINKRMMLVLLLPHFKGIVGNDNCGLNILLVNKLYSEIGSMYSLLRRVMDETRKVDVDVGVHAMKTALEEFIVEEGTNILRDYASSTEVNRTVVVETLASLLTQLQLQNRTLFESSSILWLAISDAFKVFLNVEINRVDVVNGQQKVKKISFAEILSNYVDLVLRKSIKEVAGEPHKEAERIDCLVTLFDFLKEKDVFQEFYKSRLAKRLLQTTPHEDLEKLFLGRLQRLMGRSFTYKMEAMLQDQESTSSLSKKFEQDSSHSDVPCDFAVQVLTASHWPSYRDDGLVAVPSLQSCVNAFSRYYKKTFPTRILKWINMLGSGTIQIKFSKSTKNVTGTIYQLSLLTLLDEHGSVKAKDLADCLKLDLTTIVKPQLASMYLNKVFSMLHVINPETKEPLPTGKQIGDNDLFAINPQFTHKLFKFTLPIVVLQVNDCTVEDVDARRKLQIDACIVRVMKSRQTLNGNELIDLCMLQLSRYFTPHPRMIKERVEDLIDRKYLKRDEKDNSTFEYLA